LKSGLNFPDVDRPFNRRRDAPAQVGQTARILKCINFSGGQSGRPDSGLCLRLSAPCQNSPLY